MYLNTSEPVAAGPNVIVLQAEINTNKALANSLAVESNRLKGELTRERAVESVLQTRIRTLGSQLEASNQQHEQCLRRCQQLDPCDNSEARETNLKFALLDERQLCERPEKATAMKRLLDAEPEIANTMRMGASRRHLQEMVVDYKRQLVAAVVGEKQDGRELSAHLQHNDELQRRVAEVLQPQVADLRKELDAALYRGRRHRPMMETTTVGSAETPRRNSVGAVRATQANRTAERLATSKQTPDQSPISRRQTIGVARGWQQQQCSKRT